MSLYACDVIVNACMSSKRLLPRCWAVVGQHAPSEGDLVLSEAPLDMPTVISTPSHQSIELFPDDSAPYMECERFVNVFVFQVLGLQVLGKEGFAAVCNMQYN